MKSLATLVLEDVTDQPHTEETEMPITIRQLIKVPALRTRLLAGETGLDTEVLWAHTCELNSPWEWLGSGDLLMTTGRNVPSEPEEQSKFIRSLALSGVCGLVLAEGMDSPPVTREASRVATELHFPILEAGYEVPFIAMSRVVGTAAQSETQGRLNHVLRVYDSYRTAVQNATNARELLRRISLELGHLLHVVDVVGNRIVLDTGTPLSQETLALILERINEIPSLPGVTRIQSNQDEHVIMPINTHPGWVLVADVGTASFDILLLQHINTIVAIEAERMRAETEARLTRSGRLTAQLTEANVDSEIIREQLKEFGLNHGPWQVLNVSGDPSPHSLDVMVSLENAAIAHILTTKNDVIVILTNGSAQVVETLRQRLGDKFRIGISNVVPRMKDVSDAAHQASWALQSIRPGGPNVGYYGRVQSLFLPNNLAEAQNIVSTVLGHLIEYDEQNDTDLIHSLTVFFEENRSWQTASKKLNVHKQTLVYRIRRISEITGRELSHLDDIAELHLALRTKQRLVNHKSPH